MPTAESKKKEGDEIRPTSPLLLRRHVARCLYPRGPRLFITVIAEQVHCRLNMSCGVWYWTGVVVLQCIYPKSNMQFLLELQCGRMRIL